MVGAGSVFRARAAPASSPFALRLHRARSDQLPRYSIMGGLNLEVFKVRASCQSNLVQPSPNSPIPFNPLHPASTPTSLTFPSLPITRANPSGHPPTFPTVWHVRHVPHRDHVLLRHQPRQPLLRPRLLAQGRERQQAAGRARRDPCRAREAARPQAVSEGPAAGRRCARCGAQPESGAGAGAAVGRVGVSSRLGRGGLFWGRG
ncbi:uncharacterized protein B0H64DRAFT_155357 [Chaetomium fimeti]|uniref:Uncharacterized protein n=1 Tax=Chaetomium fimeti TaxID=1854472 RepID=A0AAE0HFU4_9PEZI|nr:hypothetical protein B0H64DRAFT_155357 [Chaetomium fimeti]